MSKTDGETQAQSTIQFLAFTTNFSLPGQLEIEGNLAENWEKWKQL